MAQYRRIPTNQNLIKGAGFAASGATNTGGFVDSSAVIDKSFAQAEKRIQAQEAKARAAAEKKAVEARRKAAAAERIQARNRAELNKQKNKMASLQAQLQSNIDTSSLSSPSNINAVKDFVVGKRNRYVEIASELSKMSPFDDKYAELTSELNNVQSSIVNLAGDLKNYGAKEVDFTSMKKDLVTNSDKDRIESTILFFDPNNTLTISDNGDASFGGVNVKGYDLPALMQIESANIINNAIAKRVSSAKPLTESDRYQMKGYLTAAIKDKENAIDSLLSDGIFSPSAIKSIKEYMLANPDADKTTAFLEGTLDNVERLSQAAYDTVQAERRNSGGYKDGAPMSEKNKQKLSSAKENFNKGKEISTRRYIFKPNNTQNGTYSLIEIDQKGTPRAVDGIYGLDDILNHMKLNF